ncbi:hypothetical protein GCM10010844_22520 [Deinococcus radiotolerans]|uniref:Nudix hydrolase domain-containing protein n=2 Tax=Deinococcus radiotolerans TaxID=1309407 RepID=A0ABQ2FME4_9DEIO|nr:hypothetical protein GCM10010844_22520 [Deinococcus radiotolerans]
MLCRAVHHAQFTPVSREFTAPHRSVSDPMPDSTPPMAYQVGAFALIQHQGAYLITRPHHPLQPGAQGLPGLILNAESGLNPVALQLRRVIREQLKLVVSELRLAGSYVARGTPHEPRHAQLHLIFGTDYSAGILEPDPAQVSAAEWIPGAELLAPGGAPDWLQNAVREYELVTPPPVAAPGTSRSRLGFIRRR